MINLVNLNTNERFDNFPYTIKCCNIGVVPDFFPDFECDFFISFSRFQVPFNDEYIEGKTDDICVTDYAYRILLKHYYKHFFKGWKYKGCEDCALEGTEMCEKNNNQTKGLS